ncbi:MAG: hypothetical protein ACHQF2_02200 [Flavobacteriales bacterium]
MVAIIACVMLVSCAPSAKRKKEVINPNLSFYYWRTDFKLGETERDWIKETRCQKMYVRFFDLDFEQYGSHPGVIPIGRLQNIHEFPENVNVVPVVYITQDAIGALEDRLSLYTCAKRTVEKITRMAKRHGCNEIKEYQLDCDWTSQTKKVYFDFIEEIKKLVSPATVSVTLRLYQYKYRKESGIPPADRVTLMYYNMGNFQSTEDKSYILDNKTGVDYIRNTKPYPVKLDMALPLYYQSRLFSTAQSGFISFISPQKFDLVEDLDFMQKKGIHTYEVHKNNWCTAYESATRYQDFQPGLEDFCRAEWLIDDKYEYEELEEAFNILKQTINCSDFQVIFFHLDSTYLNNYNANELKNMVSCMQ